MGSNKKNKQQKTKLILKKATKKDFEKYAIPVYINAIKWD